MSVLMKGVTITQQETQKLLPAKLDHSLPVMEGVLLEPEDGRGLYEAGPEWLEKAFDQGYDLIGEAEDAIDCLLNNYGKHVPKHMRKRLLAVHSSLEEYLKFYEGENV